MRDDRSSTLLVVCTANVCRSPLVESVLRREIALAGGALGSIAVRSAGTHAVADQAMCAVSAAESADDGFARSHRSRLLDRTSIRDSDLVLTAEREHRGAVARLAPGSQARVFTVLEAVGLAEVAADRIRGGEVARPADLRAVAALLHSSRGRVPLQAPPPPARGLFRRRPPAPAADPLDITDGHGGPPAEHAAAVRRAHDAADRFVAALAILMAGDEPEDRQVD